MFVYCDKTSSPNTVALLSCSTCWLGLPVEVSSSVSVKICQCLFWTVGFHYLTRTTISLISRKNSELPKWNGCPTEWMLYHISKEEMFDFQKWHFPSTYCRHIDGYPCCTYVPANFYVKQVAYLLLELTLGLRVQHSLHYSAVVNTIFIFLEIALNFIDHLKYLWSLYRSNRLPRPVSEDMTSCLFWSIVHR